MKVHELAEKLEELEVRGFGDYPVIFSSEYGDEQIRNVGIVANSDVELSSEALQ
ncbi:hypothetical protein [Bifidobacterium tibiigranuli]|jgi:hypothetical protein|uniref:hypothetical protein n=1 Tax=Bifidobacterium tibiigranuli TaxID=2172043 RepID=UPI0023550566|nr:hypothetical protein [Bifidobacterium tibiigranuli]MCI1211024.1 hypothetical protein [Bifidobacterium tibiigranuli]MCI1221789.1 hypothetical protein [Bifidobacterium tibiigranuli]